jgi:hypothetical protein
MADSSRRLSSYLSSSSRSLVGPCAHYRASAGGVSVNKQRRQRTWLAAGCLMCFLLALRNTKGLEGTEFSGGWLTGPLLSMTDVGTILFAIAFIAAFFFPRIAAGVALVSSALCLPLYLYFLAPVHSSQIFGPEHEFKVPPGFHVDLWALAGLLMVAITGYLCFRGFRRDRSLTSNAPQLPSL